MEEIKTHHTCKTCNVEKPFTNEFFHKNKHRKWGLTTKCKDCCKKYREENAEYFKEYGKKYRKENAEYFSTYIQEWNDKHPDYHTEYFHDNKEDVYYRMKTRRKNNPLIKMREKIRTHLSTSFKRRGWSKKTQTYKYLGCQWEQFEKYIESQFVDGMTWDNHGEWEYDHYYPVSLAEKPEDMFILFNYTNYQPLWKKDNRDKSDKVPDGFEEWYEMMRKKVL